MKVTAFIPPKHFKRIQYTLSILLESWLGLEVSYKNDDENQTTLEINDKKLIFRDYFFDRANDLAYLLKQLDRGFRLDLQHYFKTAEVLEEKIPVLFGPEENIPLLCIDDNAIEINGDVLGSAFFLLTGYESKLHNRTGQYVRLFARDSLIKEYLHRPLVNEYAELLKQLLNILLPGLQFKTRKFHIIPTHDVDHPFEYYDLRYIYLLQRLAGDAFLRKKIDSHRVGVFKKVNKREIPDAYDTFNWIFEKERDAGVNSICYFFAGEFALNNPDYRLNDKSIQQLAERVTSAGHEVGIHLGLKTSTNLSNMLKEKEQFLKIMNMERISYSRQHFLDFVSPITWRLLSNCCIAIDSSSAFPDRPGFRNGSCYPYQVYDYEEDQILPLIEMPLVFMEGSLLDKIYMGLCYEDARGYIDDLRTTVKRYNGDFVFLWHNHRLIKKEDRELFCHTLGLK
jgi:hypothetical protein